MISRRFALLCTLGALILLAAGGTFIAARSVTVLPACAAGNTGELVLDTSGSPATLKYCDGSSFRGFTGTIGTGGAGAIQYRSRPMQGSVMRSFCYKSSRPELTALVPFHCTNQELAAGGSIAGDATTSTAHVFTRYTTGTTANNTAYTGMNATSAPGQAPTYEVLIRTSADLTSQHLYIGGGASVISAVGHATASVTSVAGTGFGDIALVMYDAGTNSDWWACSDNSTNYQCTDMALAVVADTEYVISTSFASWPTNVSFSVTPVGGSTTTVTRTTLLPRGVAAWGPIAKINTTTTAARYFLLNSMWVEFNG